MFKVSVFVLYLKQSLYSYILYLPATNTEKSNLGMIGDTNIIDFPSFFFIVKFDTVCLCPSEIN